MPDTSCPARAADDRTADKALLMSLSGMREGTMGYLPLRSSAPRSGPTGHRDGGRDPQAGIRRKRSGVPHAIFGGCNAPESATGGW
ncbi:hypothetical protein GCM10010350_81730 [Streptomyces galilaeus]|nr:hypothetical protein GCM10010350_81730 [Streptomyces galilaeus]